jgi:hypothetical protein
MEDTQPINRIIDPKEFLEKEESERKTRVKLKARRIALLFATAMVLLIVALIWLGAYELVHPGACACTIIVAVILTIASSVFATNDGEDLPW